MPGAGSVTRAKCERQIEPALPLASGRLAELHDSITAVGFLAPTVRRHGQLPAHQNLAFERFLEIYADADALLAAVQLERLRAQLTVEAPEPSARTRRR